MIHPDDPRIAPVTQAIVAQLGDEDCALPRDIIRRAAIRALNMIDAMQENQK